MIDTIMFCFGGRRENLELQLPLIRDALSRNPALEYHLWDLARDDEDSKYIRQVGGERIRVITSLRARNPWERFPLVYRHYAKVEFSGKHFVKLDDDIVFLESRRVSDFIRHSRQRPDSITSARVFNNGACSVREPGLERLPENLGIPLLDAHKSAEFAMTSHDRLINHWRDLVDGAGRPYNTQDWLSINMISYNWDMAVRIAALVNTTSPSHIAGRNFGPAQRLGDEGVVNMMDRLIHPGMVAAHLTFGPQRLSSEQFQAYRNWYAELGREYLAP